MVIEQGEKPVRELVPISYLLGFYAKEKEISAYDLYKRLKYTSYRRAYANIRLRLQELVKLKLIEQTKEWFPPHAAKKYKLTGLGIEFLLLDKDWLGEYRGNLNQFTDLLATHGDHTLFKVFLFSFFSTETIKNIKSDHIIYEILQYLRQCIEYIRRYAPPFDLEDYERNLIEEQFIPVKNYILDRASDHVEKLTFALIKYADKVDPHDLDLSDDLQLLAQDRKFLKGINQARKRLDKSYKQFMKYAN